MKHLWSRWSCQLLAVSLSVIAVPASQAGWSYAPWTGDADSGISSVFEYPVAVNFTGGGGAVTVNGVFFEDSTVSGANFSIEGEISGAASGSPNVSGDSYTLANAFIYGGNPRTVTLTNLTPGATYETTFFAFGWESSGRIQTFATGSDSLELDQDLYGQNNGIRITYSFVASSSSQVFTITPASEKTFHLSALANCKVAPARILSFGGNVAGSTAVIGTNTIAWTVPYGTDVTSLAPTFTVTSGAATPASGSTRNFSSPQTYTVIDGATTNTYAVTVTRTGWSYALWTGDADSGVSNAYPYTVAVNIAGGVVTLNGVAFDSQPGSYPWSGANYLVQGFTSGYGGSPNLTGDSLMLGQDFLYDNPPYSVTLTNLTPGETYETTFFSYGFGASGRLLTFSSGGDSRVIDQNAYGAGNGIRILYTFDATANAKVITIDGSLHLCALANRWVAPPATILSFGSNVDGSSAIIGANTIAWTVPYSANLATLAPAYTLDAGATCTPASGSTNNFTGPVVYTVVVGNVTNAYTVTATKAPPSTACEMLAFTLNLPGTFADVVPAGTSTNAVVVVHVPAGMTDAQVQSLVPTLTLSRGATCPVPSPALGRSTTVYYTVMAEDGVTTKRYAVMVVFDAEGFWRYAPWTGDADSGIVSTSLYPVALNCGGGAVTVNGVTFEANATNGANFAISGASAVASGAHNLTGNSSLLASDFIAGGDPAVVTLKNLTPGATYEVTLFAFAYDAANVYRRQDFESGGAHLLVDQNIFLQKNGVRMIHTFVADASSRVVTISPIEGPTFHMSALANRKLGDPPAAAIVQFGANIAGSSAVLSQPDDGAGAITWTLPYGMGLTSLAPSYTLSSGAGNPASGSSRNFSSPVTYTVIDGAITNVYIVTATNAQPSAACDLLTFNANLAGSRATILPTGTNTGTIVVNVPAGTTAGQLSGLSPSLTVSPYAACTPPTPPLSLTSPVHYVVTAQDGFTTMDYTATVVTNAEAFSVMVVQASINGLAAADYDYLAAVPVSRHRNAGVPAVFAVASTNDLSGNAFLLDFLRRYRPTLINTVNFSAAIPGYTAAAITAAGPVELSLSMATNFWSSSSNVVLVSDAVTTNNYPNVLQASALAAALNAPMLYYNSGKEALVQTVIARLGATEVVYVNAAGTKPAMAGQVLTGPASIVSYLAGRGVKPDYFALANPKDLNLLMGSKISLTAPFLAARRGGLVVPITGYTPNTNELFHYSGYPAISSELRQLYREIGRYPEYLALVGSPTAIPLSYTAGINQMPNQILNAPTDRDYANADEDLFPDIAIGRIMAFNLFDATLYTCRISTYEQLFDGDWERSYCNRTRSPSFENYGFRFKEARMKDAGAGKPFNAAFFGHGEHSSEGVLGGFFGTGSTNILAPLYISSGGCTVAGVDFETVADAYGSPYNVAMESLVVNALVRMGAVAFVGCTRLADAWTARMFGVFGIEALKGEPLGRCYQKGAVQNIIGADYWFMDQGRKMMYLGDPAFRLHVPSEPQYAQPAQVVSNTTPSNAVLSLTAVPYTDFFRAQHTEDHIREWGQTPPIYFVDMPGIYDDGGGTYICMVNLTTDKPITSVTQINSVAPGFGGVNGYSIDYRQDGTMGVMWHVAMHDWEWKAGVVNNQVTNIQFQIAYDLVPDITSFNANLDGSGAIIQSLSNTNGTVTIYVPVSTTDGQIAALAPTYTLDFGATCNQASGAVPSPPLSTNTPVPYIVSPGAGSSNPPKVYAVSVVRSPFISAAWTGDEDSGITTNFTYTVAVNCGGGAVNVNGVAFQSDAASGTNFLIAGAGAVASGSPAISGNSYGLGADFIYGGNPCAVTLLNLTPGKSYETTFFCFGWEATGRPQTFASGSASRVLDQDACGENRGLRILYRFVADSTNRVITVTPAADPGTTLHLSALANREIGPPAALFSGIKTNGYAPLRAVFTDSSTGTITNRHWAFGDSSSRDTLSQLCVTNLYTTPGEYTVQLAVSGPGGVATNAQPGLVRVSDVPVPVIAGGDGGGLCLSNNALSLAVNSINGLQYRLVYKENLLPAGGSWTPVTPPLPAGWTVSGQETIILEAPLVGGVTQRFFKVESKSIDD